MSDGRKLQREVCSLCLELRPGAQQETTESSAGMKRHMEPSTRRKTSTPITVVIVGKDPIVSRAIESLLRAADHTPRLVTEPVTDGSHRALAEAHVVLLATGLSAESRKKLLGSGVSNLVAGRTPILELVSEADEGRPPQGHHQVHWPCSLEQLRREIEAALIR